MPNYLISRRETYKVGTHSEIISSANPNGDVGVTKTESHTGFFVHTSIDYELWFKDQNGIWGMHKAFTGKGGNTFAWGTNQAFYLKTAAGSGRIKVYKRVGAILIDSTPQDNNDSADSLVVEDATSMALLDKTGQEISTISVGSSDHSSLSNLEWNVSGHTGAAYSVVMFDENGSAVEISAPAVGQRADKVLKWVSDTEINWVAQ